MTGPEPVVRIFCALLVLAVLGGSPARIQEFTLYAGGNGESEESENYTNAVADLNTVSPIVRGRRLESVCAQAGVWAFFTGKNYTTINSYGYHPATPDWTCSKRRISGDYMSPFQSIRHLGNSDLDTPSLSLYKEPFFASTELYLDGNELSLPGQEEFASFGFTGRESWTLYSGSNFSGDSVCLQCKCDTEGIGIGVTYTAKLSLVMASVRKGCFGNQTLTPEGQLVAGLPNKTGSTILNTWPSLRLQNSKTGTNLSMSGSEARLTCSESYDSFSISRISNWTIYSDSEYGGKSVCLRSADSAGGVQYFQDGALRVGSIKFGCSSGTKLAPVVTFNPLNPPTNIGTSNYNRGTTVMPPPNTGTTNNGRGTTLAPPTNIGTSNNDGTSPVSRTNTASSNNGQRTTLTPPTNTGSANNGPGTTLAPPTNTNTTNSNRGSPSRTGTTRSPSNSRQGKTLNYVPGDLEGYVPSRPTRPTFVNRTTQRSPIPSSTTTELPEIHEIIVSTKSDFGNVLQNRPTTPGSSTGNETGERLSSTTQQGSSNGGPGPTTQRSSVTGSGDQGRPSASQKVMTTGTDADEDKTSTAGIFFVAFLVILGILILAMLGAIGVLIYRKCTREDQTDVTPA